MTRAMPNARANDDSSGAEGTARGGDGTRGLERRVLNDRPATCERVPPPTRHNTAGSDRAMRAREIFFGRAPRADRRARGSAPLHGKEGRAKTAGDVTRLGAPAAALALAP